MLGKLLKYDFKASYRYLLVCYCVYIVLTVGFVLSVKGVDTASGVPGMILAFAFISLTFLWIGSIIGLVILTYILVIRRFYVNLVRDEGYLTLTLPVSTRMHMLSKLLSGLCFIVLTAVVLMAGMMIVAAGLGGANVWEELAQALRDFFETFESFYGALFFVNSVLNFIRGILLIYFSICVGQMFAKHKIWGAIGAYLGLLIVLELFVFIGSLLFGIYGGLNGIVRWFYGSSTWGNTIYIIAQILVYFFLGAWILEKRANLE